jgi:hypothetical protein
MWASPSEIKENAASLKKFYTFLHKVGEIEEKDLKELIKTIKEEIPHWLATMDRYDDPEVMGSDLAFGHLILTIFSFYKIQMPECQA